MCNSIHLCLSQKSVILCRCKKTTSPVTTLPGYSYPSRNSKMNALHCQARPRMLLLLSLLPLLVLSLPMEKSHLGRKAADHSPKRETPWTWNKGDFPNPQSQQVACNQPKPSYICDPDQKLGQDEAERLNQLMIQLQTNSRCLCPDDCSEEGSKGIVFGIAIMDNMFHTLDASMDEVAHQFATTIMEKWRLGTCGNGVLLLLAMDNKIFHIETGSAVQKVVTEDRVTTIFEECKGHLADGHIYQGLQSIINSFRDQPALSAGFQEEPDTSQSSVPLTVGLVVGFAALAGLFAAGLVVVRKRRQNTVNNDKFMYDGSGSHSGIRSESRPSSRNGSGKKDISGPIVKTPVVFPDAVYQPCSVDESVRIHEEDEDSENQYLRTLEENPSYESADAMRQPRELNVVTEEDNEQHTEEQMPMAAVHSQNNTNLNVNT